MNCHVHLLILLTNFGLLNCVLSAAQFTSHRITGFRFDDRDSISDRGTTPPPSDLLWGPPNPRVWQPVLEGDHSHLPKAKV